MILDEFNRQQDEILLAVPAELRPVLSYMAYERSHAYGYEETLNTLRNMVHDILDAVLAYGRRMERLGREWKGA